MAWRVAALDGYVPLWVARGRWDGSRWQTSSGLDRVHQYRGGARDATEAVQREVIDKRPIFSPGQYEYQSSWAWTKTPRAVVGATMAWGPYDYAWRRLVTHYSWKRSEFHAGDVGAIDCGDLSPETRAQLYAPSMTAVVAAMLYWLYINWELDR